VANGEETTRPVLLFDADCGFCTRGVRFVLKRDRRRRTLRFAGLSGGFGERVRSRHPELSDVDSVVWFEEGGSPGNDTVLVKSAAAMRVARYLGGVWAALARVGGVIPRRWRDALYDTVARRRQRLASACAVPTTEERERFVDEAGWPEAAVSQSRRE
jgi:predicted DCC family thiol-disulfide oxidoreductase YuxK